MPSEICLIRHNSKPPYYYPDSALLYSLNTGMLHDNINSRYVDRCHVCIEELGAVLRKEGVEFIIVSIDFTNCRSLKRLKTEIPVFLVIGDTHHGSQPVSLIRDCIDGLNVKTILMTFTPWHARLFADIADVYFIEGLCPNTDWIGRQGQFLGGDRANGEILLTGSIGGTHHRRRGVFDMLMSKGIINGREITYKSGNIERLIKEYGRAWICINCPLSIDINQRHWEILASGGVPLYMPSQRIRLHDSMDFIKRFSPPKDIENSCEQTAWAVENRAQLENAANEAKRNIDLLNVNAKCFMEGLCREGAPMRKKVQYIRWVKEISWEGGRKFMNKITMEAERYQEDTAPGVTFDFDRLDKFLSSSASYEYSKW